MAGRSAAKSKPIRKQPGSSFHKLLKNPQVPFALALLFADAILVAIIIAYVPCKHHSQLYLYLLKLNKNSYFRPSRLELVMKWV